MRTSIDRHQSYKYIEIKFEGQSISAIAGESLAATLAANNLLDLRSNRIGASRGIYCGMGVCQECLVEVDGHQNQRACMVEVDRPMSVLRQQFPGNPPNPREINTVATPSATQMESIEMVVVGGGVAGMSAAAVAAEAGVKVMLLEDRSQLGGQFCKQPIPEYRLNAKTANDPQFMLGRNLTMRVINAGVEVITGAQVWAGFPEKDLLVTCNHRTRYLRPSRLVIATGAYEQGVPFPGWTLPGVMTTGAAQTLLRKYRVIPGQRILLAGHGPFNFHVAIELAREGAEVIALAELSPAPGLWSAKALFDMYRGSRQLLAQGIQYRMELNRWKISPLYNHCISSVEQINNSLKVELALWNDGALKPGPNFEVDIVCTGYGFYPSNILLRSLGCSHRFDHSQKQLVTDRSDDLETTISGIYAVGDCAGLGGAKAAVEEGIIAGVHATNSLNYLLSSQLSQEHTTARTRLAQHRRFQSGLWRLFAGPKLNLHLAKPETEVCRCESVTLENIDFAIRDGCISVGQIKQYTRAGMGACQGRYCSALLAELVADKTHTPLDHHSFFAPRAPISPIRIGDIGRLGKAE